MQGDRLPSGKAYTRRILLHTSVFVLGAVAVISLYLTGLLRLSPGQWRGFAQIVAGALLVIFPLMILTHWRIFQRVRVCLDHRAAGTATPEELRAGFAALSDFPRYWFVWGLGWWALGGAIVAAGMWLRYEGFGLFQAGVIVAATVSAAFVTDMYYYLTIKRQLEPARVALAADIGDPAARRALRRPVTLRSKLLASTTSLILITAVYASLLAHVRAERGVEQEVLAGQRRVVEAAARGEISLEDAAADATRYGVAQALLVLDPEARGVVAGPADALLPHHLAHIRAAGLEAGDSETAEGGSLYAWRRLSGDGRILVAATPRAALSASSDGPDAFAALVVLATGVAVGAAWLLARDVGHATAALRRRAERVAAGDLSAREILESEDDLGDLAYAFESMEASLAATVARVAGAADRMQAAASDIASAAQNVARVSADQVAGIDEADAAMGSIDQQIQGISQSAERLSAAMQEATSAVFELDATGGELNDSAGSLSGSVDEVTASIEQLVRSIGQVARNADNLAGAADDASSSMSQTAAMVREVDANASEMARLSGEVVALSEKGRERVRQTIGGMEAIRQTTQTAEAVIRRLAERAHAIGAIVNVIDDVADETSLLALNAAIIAAQAGEHGRAFSVVADEIKSLAERVLESTKEISGLIRSVQEEATQATGAVGEGAHSVSRGVELAGEAGVSLEEITRAARESGARVDEIVASVREQAEAVEHVAHSMNQVREGTKHIRQAIWEQGRSTGVLRQNTHAVNDVSGRVRATAEEQVRSSGHIKQVVQECRAAVERIDAALRDQSEGSRSAVQRLRHVAERTRVNEESVRRLEEAMQTLQHQARDLRDEVARFRI